MLFNSLDFVVFFVFVYALYLLLDLRGQNVLLLVSSYFFYGCWDWRFLFLIFISTGIDFICALQIHRAEQEWKRRLYLWISVCTNLGILFFFKYFGFFVESAQAMLAHLGVSSEFSALHFILPVGISFYTFQTMSYTIDVYRRNMKACSSLMEFSVYVAFFPQLVAGPIERASRLLPQFRERRQISYAMIREAGWLVLLGYFKKTVVADNMAPFVNAVFDNPEQAHGLAIIVGILAFSFQIYGDFSGYSDIARGISKLMGFDLMVNFRMPFFALNPQDFWSRWHISLSTWLRDYLYIPLGGNRKGAGRTYVNLMLTMLLGGLWHGAAWNYVLWGFYQGSLLVIYRLLGIGNREDSPARKKWAGVVMQWVIYFILTELGWLIFRVNALQDIFILIKNIWVAEFWCGYTGLLSLVIFGMPLIVIDAWQEYTSDLLAVKRWPRGVRLFCYAAIIMSIICCAWVKRIEFIYFQF